MNQKRVVRLSSAAAALASATISSAAWFGTGSGATSYYGGALFNLQNVSDDSIQLTGKFNLIAASSATGEGVPNVSYSVYFKNSALSGTETDSSLWTLLGTWTGTTNQQSAWTTIDVGNSLEVGSGLTIALAVLYSSSTDLGGGYVGYRSGAGAFDNGEIKLTTGLAKGLGFTEGGDLFNVRTFSNRTWAGEVEYQAVPEPASMVLLAGIAASAVWRRRRNLNR